MRQGLIERVLQRSDREETIGRGKHAVPEHKHGLAHALKRFRFQTKEIKSRVKKQHQLQQVQSTRQNVPSTLLSVFDDQTPLAANAKEVSRKHINRSTEAR